MQVIGENDYRIHGEWSPQLHESKCGTQCVHVIRQKVSMPFQQSHGEKERTAGNVCANVTGHGRNFTGFEEMAGFAALLPPYSTLTCFINQ